jgi:curved DNA-binding protein CbpA
METEHALASWLRVLDELTYYELFGLAPDAGADDIHAAFHAFCDAFHPDRHVARDERERQAVSAIFKRGAEAFVVLSDERLRAHYDAQLAVDAAPRRLSFSSRPPPSSRAPGSTRLEDAARSPAARPFARRAEELVRQGDLRQAKLQLVMANHMDPGNEALEAALRDVEQELKQARRP